MEYFDVNADCQVLRINLELLVSIRFKDTTASLNFAGGHSMSISGAEQIAALRIATEPN